MVTAIPGDVIIEPAGNRQAGQSQPIQALQNLEAPLDDAAVRAAIVAAEANSIDPQSIRMSDLAQGQVNNPPQQAAVPSKPVEVPEKFLKPDGVVDVEKIQASSRQLDEAIQKKEEALSKTVDDYMREYNEKQTKFRSMLNPDRFANPPAPAPVSAQPDPNGVPANFEEIVRRDYQVDPLGTVTRLMATLIDNKFKPIEETQKIEATRKNIASLADKDPRVLRQDVFDAINAELASDPDYWKLKNPHKAAYLEVKERMRLGDPVGSVAQPSRPSPVLGGGTPPSAPSVSVPQTPQSIFGSLGSLDLRDRKQEEMGDAAVRAFLEQNRY